MRVGVIGTGAIGRFVMKALLERQQDIAALLVRPETLAAKAGEWPDIDCVASVAELPEALDLVIDCAGHTALQAYGPDVLRRGTDLLTVSIGALADDSLHGKLEQAAVEGNSRLHLASGAIGALDCLQAARTGKLEAVTYLGRKPPAGWRGSPAESRLDLDALGGKAAVHFDGNAREAATEYPKNANVAAAVALAGIGFDATRVQLIADPEINENIHEIEARGDFGHFTFRIAGQSLPDNPRSSALAAMSVLARLEQASSRVSF